MPQTIHSLLSSEDVLRFRKRLAGWYRVHARRLPWRDTGEPYHTWVSEIMLQQTRVNAVIDHYHRFLLRFPTILALALAPEEDVLALWSGLGYYRRARMLHRAAQFVVSEHKGVLPQTSAALRTMPGIGEYTSAAIASIAFNEQVAVIDGNVERVLLRIAGSPEAASKTSRDFLRQQAQALVPKRNPGDHNQAMMELGATVCLPRAPLCNECPVHSLCKTRGEHLTLPRTKMRSQRIAFALALRKNGLSTEVLLHRRAKDASLMPGMLELPQIAPEQYADLQPILRVRHSITNTNYYVEVYGIGGSIASIAPTRDEINLLHDVYSGDQDKIPASEDADGSTWLAENEEISDDEDLTLVDTNLFSKQRFPLFAVTDADPQAGDSVGDPVLWVRSLSLGKLPITGLTRKILRRLDVMAVPLPISSIQKAAVSAQTEEQAVTQTAAPAVTHVKTPPVARPIVRPVVRTNVRSAKPHSRRRSVTPKLTDDNF